LILIQFNF